MMNKYKEALVSLTDWFHSYKDSNGVLVQERHITEDYRKAERTIGELVERATPKKVDIIGDYNCICPNCENALGKETLEFGLSKMYRWARAYCPMCGQALDWSGHDD